MATATAEMQKKTITTEVQEEVVTLTMSRDEAKVLRAALGCIGGGMKTYHKHTTALRGALREAGIVSYGPDYFTGTLCAKYSDGSAYISFV